MSWAQLLYRVLFIEALLRAACGGRMKVVAFLSDPKVVKRILDHLGLPSTAPTVFPAVAVDPGPRLWEDVEWGNGDVPAGDVVAVERGRDEEEPAPL